MNEDLAPQVEDQVTDAPVVEEKPLSLRETISKASEDAKDTPEVKADRARANDGKFVKNIGSVGQKATPEPKQPQTVAAPVVSTEIKPHERYPETVRSKWSSIPSDIQVALNKSADDFHRLATTHDEERNYGKQFKEVVAPYIAQMRAEGANPIQATQALYDTAYRLRTGTPQQKGQLLWETARQFGADMSQGMTQQAQAPVHPLLQQTLQEVQSMKADMEKQQAFKKQQEDAGIQSQIETFKADPKNVHFEAVKAHMASLLSGGLAKDLQDAYDQAVYANPQTRASQLEALNRDSQEKRVADQKAKAEAAKKAGSSIKGSPGMAATRDPKVTQPDLRSELKAAFAAQGNA